MELNDMLLKQLECPMCFESCRPPIFMCKNGHNLCSSCKTRVAACPVCREPGSPSNRNILAEAITDQVQAPCRYADDGCDVRASLNDLEKHHSVCDHRYVCMKCEWTGKLGELLDHVKKMHEEAVCVKERSFVFNIDEKDAEEFKLMYCDAGLFWTALRFSGEYATFCFYTQYIGKNENAENYTSTMKLWTTDGKVSLTCDRPTLTKDDDYLTHKNTIKLGLDTIKSLTQGNLFHYSQSVKKYQTGKVARPVVENWRASATDLRAPDVPKPQPKSGSRQMVFKQTVTGLAYDHWS